jgi:hypothetical protein
MDAQLVRRIAGLEKRLDGLQIPEKSLLLAAPFLQLPVLRGLWVSSVNSGGNWYDLSGLGKTLTYNGNPQVAVYNDRFAYWYYDGVGDYHRRADEADLQIVGTEGFVATAARGLTMGGWFYATAGGAAANIIGKANDTNGPYFLYSNPAGTQWLFRVRDAADAANSSVTTTQTTNQWTFVVGRYDPGTEVKIWANGVINTNVAGIPASILNAGDDFAIGAEGDGGGPFTGGCAVGFLCAGLASDAMVGGVFQATRGLFGV